MPTTHPSDRIHFISARFYKDSTTFCKDSVRIPKCFARIPEDSARNSHDFLIFAKFLQIFHNILQGFQKILQGIHMIPWYLQIFSLESEYKDSSRFHGIPQDDEGFLKILQYFKGFYIILQNSYVKSAIITKKMDSNSPRGRHLKHNNLPIILLPTIFFKEFFLEDILSRNILSLLYSLKTGE